MGPSCRWCAIPWRDWSSASIGVQLGIELQGVEFLPSGFFGVLFDWFDLGVRIRLYAPERRVRNMIWFRQFFVSDGHARFHMTDSAPLNERQAAEWSRDDWEVSRSVAASL
jgi:hypothetical protein